MSGSSSLMASRGERAGDATERDQAERAAI
jgi:hypothetical protein